MFWPATVAAQSSSVIASWNANSESNIAGYKFRQGTASGVYNQVTDVGNVTNVLVPNLAGNLDYYFVVSAYNTLGLESPFSNEAKTIHNDAKLQNLILSAGALAPGFSGGTQSYTASVSNSVASTTLTPTPNDGAATVTVNGVVVPYGTASQNIALNVGDNTLTVGVTARDTTTKMTYTVVVTRLTALETWRLTYFGTTANTGPAADTATPQNDEITNLMKFATGMDPTKRGLQPGALALSGSNLVFTYTRSKSAAVDGISCAVEWSDTMSPGSWSSSGVSETIIDQGQTELVTATLPAGTNRRRFVILVVTKP